MIDIEPAVTVEEMMLATGKSRATVYRMLAAGDIPSVKGTHGGRIVPRPLFRRFLDGTWTKPDSATFVRHLQQRAS